MFSHDFKNIFHDKKNGLTKIIFVNVVLFLAVNIADEILKLFTKNFSLVYLLALRGEITFALQHCWTFITYMFLHKDIFHILFNMLWLYWLGKIFIEYVGGKRFVGVYLLGGISGGVLYLITANIFPQYFQNSFLLGASAGVMAVVISIAVLLPDYIIHLLFFGGVRLKYLALFSFVFTSLLDISQNTGGKISHIGGALFGFVFMIQYKKGTDITVWLNNFMDYVIRIFINKKPKMKISYKKK